MGKRICIWALILGLAGSSAWADLVGYWPLDGGVATDLSVNSNHGAISGSVSATTDRNGNPNSAMSFAGGSGDLIDVGDAPAFNLTGAMTITAWVYLDSTSGVHGSRNSRILAKMGSTRAWSSGIEANVDGVPYPATIQVSSNGSTIVGLHDDSQLPLDQWVHFAGVYTPGAFLAVYLDGDLSDIRTDGIPVSQFSNNGRSVLIGNRPDCSNCGWYGALDEVRLYNEALSESEIEGIMGSYVASNPDPPDEAFHVDPTSVLSWDAPASVPSPVYDVYLGTDPNFAGETPVSNDQSGTSYDPNPDLQLATPYHWQIVVDDIHEGPVWSFTTQGLASDPDPEDEEVGVNNVGTMLSWTGETAVLSYDVYLGTSESAVAAADRMAVDINGDGSTNLLDLEVLFAQWLTSPSGTDPNADLDGSGFVNLADYAMLVAPDPTYKGNQPSTTFDPGTLDLDTTYYWRIDEVFAGGIPKGNVWDFTTWAGSGDKDLGETNGEMWEYLEWNLVNPSWSGNPFDLVATVTFTHTPSASTHTTEMFYDDSNTWKFRFTGTKTGEWSFTTASSDPDLDGYHGIVNISPNPDPNARGFLTNQGNKFAIQTGNSGETQGYLLNVYMNGEDFPAFIHNLTSTATIEAYIVDAQQYNFDTIFVHVCNNWFDFGSINYDEHNSEDPDPQTFAALETLIAIARSQGTRVQIWAWGDQARRWTPIGVGGINGVPDRRLQRYIAARLGPLPGWTMGYGFDLQEWVNEAQVGAWAQYLHQHFGWQHMVWGRGRTHSELDAVSYSGKSDGGQPFSYDDAVSKLDSDLSRPHFYEERFSYLREGAWTMENTRRAIWHYALAGGIGAWWGFYEFGVAQSPYPPYPNPEYLATVNQFWPDRFLLDMARANTLTDGYCLKTTTNDNYVFYKEDTSSVQMDLSGMAGPLPAIAVDTKLSYAEIDLGTLSTTNQTWTAPYDSDWAIAVGDFD